MRPSPTAEEAFLTARRPAGGAHGQLGGQQHAARPAPVAAVEQHLPGHAALLAQRLSDGGEAHALRLRGAVETGDREVVGHGEPAVARVPQRTQRQHVRRADDRGQIGVRGKQLRSGRHARLRAVVEPLDDGHTGPVDTDLGESVAQSGEPVTLHGVGGTALPLQAGRAIVVPGGQAHADHPDAAVAVAGQVACQREHAGPVVDADAVDPLDADRLVADDGGHRSLEDGEEVRVVLPHRVDDEPVDPGLVHGGDVDVVGADRDEQQALPCLLAGQGEAFEEAGGRRVAEGVGQGLGEQEPDRAGLAGAQRTGDGIGARIAQPARGLQHPRAQGRGELVGAVVGVGHGRPGHAEFGSERRQGGWSSRLRQPGHLLTVTVQ